MGLCVVQIFPILMLQRIPRWCVQWFPASLRRRLLLVRWLRTNLKRMDPEIKVSLIEVVCQAVSCGCWISIPQRSCHSRGLRREGFRPEDRIRDSWAALTEKKPEGRRYSNPAVRHTNRAKVDREDVINRGSLKQGRQ
ncbi:hypothetical protein SLA2020_277860 [Shorea laevis]